MNPYLRIAKTSVPASTWLYSNFFLEGNWPETGPLSKVKPPIRVVLGKHYAVVNVPSPAPASAGAIFKVYLGDLLLMEPEGEKWLGIEDGLFVYHEDTYERKGREDEGLSGEPHIDIDAEDRLLWGIQSLEHYVVTDYRGDSELMKELNAALIKAYEDWTPLAPLALENAAKPIIHALTAHARNIPAEAPFMKSMVCPNVRFHSTMTIRWAYWPFKGFTEESLLPIFLLTTTGGSRKHESVYLDPEKALDTGLEWCEEQKTLHPRKPMMPEKDRAVHWRSLQTLIQQSREKVEEMLARREPDESLS